MSKDLHVARAVHRAQRATAPVLFLELEHALGEVLPMPARFPDALTQELRRAHLGVALANQLAARRLLEQPTEQRAARVPEGHAGGLVLKVKKVLNLGDVAMIVSVHGRCPRWGT